MGSLLVHITTGPDDPHKAALGCLLAKTAKAAGHDVSVFFAADGAYFVREDVIAGAEGLGLGKLSDHIPALVEAGVPIYVSRMSAEARGMSEADLEATGATFAKPDDLVELTFAHDRMLSY
jgi:predicted peroxiredoxin